MRLNGRTLACVRYPFVDRSVVHALCRMASSSFPLAAIIGSKFVLPLVTSYLRDLKDVMCRSYQVAIGILPAHERQAL